MLPSGLHSRIGVLCIRNSHPAYQNPSSLLILKGLLGIEIKSPIQLVNFLYFKISRFKITFQLHPYALMDIFIINSPGIHALRTAGKKPLSVYLKHIRTFPHISKGLPCSNAALQSPVLQILRLIEKHQSSAVPIPGSQNHIFVISPAKNLRIPHMVA